MVIRVRRRQNQIRLLEKVLQTTIIQLFPRVIQDFNGTLMLGSNFLTITFTSDIDPGRLDITASPPILSAQAGRINQTHLLASPCPSPILTALADRIKGC